MPRDEAPRMVRPAFLALGSGLPSSKTCWWMRWLFAGLNFTNIRFTREIPREWNLSQTQRIQMVTDPRSHARLRFLLVDDMELNLQVLKNMFIRLGVQNLVLAHNGQEAIVQLEKEDAPFDAVLTDMWMPEMGGGDLVKRIRGDARFATLPVFAVTADVEIIKTYQELGFTGLLLKPITLQTLTEFLENFSKTSWK